MYVIAFTIGLDESCFEAGAHILKDGLQLRDGVFIEDAAPVFGHKDQVDVQIEDTVTSVPDVNCLVHRPLVYFRCGTSSGIQVRTDAESSHG